MHVHFTLPRLGLGTLAIGLLWYAASSWLGIGKFSDIGKLLDPWRPTSSLIAEADANVGKAAQKIQKAALQVEGLDRTVQQEEAKLASARRSLETRKEELAIIHGHLKSSSGDSILVHANIKVSRKDAERDRSRLVQEISNLESMIAGSEKRLAELTAAKEHGQKALIQSRNELAGLRTQVDNLKTRHAVADLPTSEQGYLEDEILAGSSRINEVLALVEERIGNVPTGSERTRRPWLAWGRGQNHSPDFWSAEADRILASEGDTQSSEALQGKLFSSRR